MKLALLPSAFWRSIGCLGLLVFGCVVAQGQTAPELAQERTPYNYASTNGVPLTTTLDRTIGSDGRAPTLQRQLDANQTTVPATFGQFRSFIAFGSLAVSTSRSNLSASATFLQNAINTDLPRSGSGSDAIVMMRAQVAAPFVAQRISLLFGSVIPVPDTDTATNLLTGVLPSDYWLPEPFTTNNHTNAPYHWSPHARQVFAHQAGPVTITWKKAQPFLTKPADYDAHPDYYSVENGNYYRLFTVRHVVSGSAVKRPQKLYWTESVMSDSGKTVAITDHRITVLFAYNNNFPGEVDTQYLFPGQSPPVGAGNRGEVRTAWYDEQIHLIRAYNVEGRVFAELLGDTKSDGVTRQFLGFEIVDVSRQPTPSDVTVDLGEQLTPFQNGSQDFSALTPSLLLSGTDQDFTVNIYQGTSQRLLLYAKKVTVNLNDQLVHWLTTGVQGLLWPDLLVRYKFVWPTDPVKYSHYIRPPAATDQIASLTAIPLPESNNPTIAYQDDPDHPRAKLTSQSAYYTWLTPDFPAHRALLQYTAGDNVFFERVFSWLDQSLLTTNFTGSIATNLSSWDPTNRNFVATPAQTMPSTIRQTVNVGARIAPPNGELGSGVGEDYWAGTVVSGRLYDPTAYINPLTSGFTAARVGAIIPVNAVPGDNSLEVLWYRRNQADASKGFAPAYWPAVLGYYQIQWPDSPSEIILASNAGSGPLDSFQSRGDIYFQNDRAQTGYNPNEEHALMLAGQAYALRDDLNITAGPSYSSEPFVLLRYVAEDGRPAMRPFRVRREAPERGIIFDYITEAGHMLQAPMPLPLLGPPIQGSGISAINVNKANASNPPDGWTAGEFVDQWAIYKDFTFVDRKNNFWVYRGLHEEPALQVGTYSSGSDSFATDLTATAVRGFPFSFTLHASQRSTSLKLIPVTPLPAWLDLTALTLSGTPPPDAPLTTNGYTIIVSNIVTAATAAINLQFGVSAAPAQLKQQSPLELTYTNSYARANITYSGRPPFLAQPPAASNSFTMQFYYPSQPSFAWPGIASPPAAGTIVPYLRTRNPDGSYVGNGVAPTDPPVQIVYRPVWPDHDPIDPTKNLPVLHFGKTATVPQDGFPAIRGQSSLKVLYQQSLALGGLPDSHRYWIIREYAKTNTVVVKRTRTTRIERYNISFGPHTLTEWPAFSRAQGSNEFFAATENLYWGIKGNATGTNYDWVFRGTFAQLQDTPKPAADTRRSRPSVVLFDPTRARSRAWSLPIDVKTDTYQGRLYFPGLPPHLESRLYYIPNDDDPVESGTLTLEGRFIDTGAGDPYPQLNTLSPSEVQDVLKILPKLSGAVAPFCAPVTSLVSDETPVDSYALSAAGPGSGFVTLIAGNGRTFTNPDDPISMYVVRVGGPLEPGELKPLPSENPLSELVTFQHTLDLAGKAAEFEFEWMIAPPVDGIPLAITNELSGDTAMVALGWQPAANSPDKSTFTLGGSGIRVLADNYVTVRYRATKESHPLYNQWSSWTTPALAEGWIKRVLAGINPFNQRTSDLFNNRVNTDVSILTQAGHRWEGDIALNSSTLNNYGLIEIYETVLRRGQSLSISGAQPINYGPANDALLLAAGYINNLYMLLGDEARADASNPTIGIGTKDKTYGDIATSLFSFQGQVPSLLEEELALLRGRADFLQPAVTTPPYYNRLVWNYTRGINSGEVIYALNYNILDHNGDGSVDASDAAIMFPQGHGDAYGHYLTALTGFYSLLMNDNFDWVPATEAVNVLGVAVQVGYQHEREFAAAAAALALTGKQVADLSWRQNYQGRDSGGWESLSQTAANAATGRTEFWGTDHWAVRTGAGAYLNWLVGNAILPALDDDPTHTGIQKIDRTTVLELEELPSIAADLQATIDNAEAGATPIGLPKSAVPFDLNPNAVVGNSNGTHFEQIYERAKVALNNAVTAFDDAKDVTRLMRSEQDSLSDYSAAIEKQELTYTNMLIEVYGTPYPDDIGVGKTYVQGYAGPDIAHFSYIDESEFTSKTGGLFASDQPHDFKIPLWNFPSWWDRTAFAANVSTTDTAGFTNGLSTNHFTFDNTSILYHYEGAALTKPVNWTSSRVSPGKIQAAAANVVRRKHELYEALQAADRAGLEARAEVLQINLQIDSLVNLVQHEAQVDKLNADIAVSDAVYQTVHLITSSFEARALGIWQVAQAATPNEVIAGTSFSVEVGAILRPITTAAFFSAIGIAGSVDTAAKVATRIAIGVLKSQIVEQEASERVTQAALDISDRAYGLQPFIDKIQDNLAVIQGRLRDLDDAERDYAAVVANGERIQVEREQFRRAAAAVIQGYRTRDASFRLFRDEKLERYKTLFDLAARYAFMAAQAYDYETGLLGSTQGRQFINRIIQSRALGLVQNGEPQFAGGNSGDPGLSSALAEMHADWDVIKGRLGFNNPDAYGTTVSLRTENLRILPEIDGDSNWTDALERGRMPNILADPDVRRYCMQLDQGDGLPVPGIVLTFSTTIAQGLNLFGRPLASGDHAYSPSSFATKIFAAGVALEGYRGMDNPAANAGAINNTGATSPPDPTVSFLDATALSANPYIYLIPVGVDSMRTPPLGDQSDIRTWTVDDVSIPLPFNIGASAFSSAQPWQSGSSLSEPLFSLRKHQAFRPVSSASYFSNSIYTSAGGLQRSQYTNNRLIGRSVWNSQWKIVIPATTLLHDPAEGLDRFIKTVKDIKINFVTYSYSGN